jgi:hypothetical protein
VCLEVVMCCLVVFRMLAHVFACLSMGQGAGGVEADCD